jgi:prepilin-type N-terminal cleavage/methylation domain-containing protein
MRTGLYGWFNANLRGRKGQQGFTLIELLVVVTILGILAAIVTLSLVGITSNANANACRQEYNTVQTAIDALMADNNVDTVTPLGPTNDMTQTIATDAAGNKFALFVTLGAQGVTQTRNYTRNGTTQYYYTWDTHGKITGIGDKNGNAINNCTVKA